MRQVGVYFVDEEIALEELVTSEDQKAPRTVPDV